MNLLWLVFSGSVLLASGSDQHRYLQRISSSDKQWLEWLEVPPIEATRASEDLSMRADKLMKDFVGTSLGDVDVSCTASGWNDAYYLGFRMVLSRLANTKVHRSAGASSGGMMSFELALRGEKEVLSKQLSYGLLQEKFPHDFTNGAHAATSADHHWRILANWMMNKWSADLGQLNGKVHLALSCFSFLSLELVKVSEFSDRNLAEQAFMATGTFLEKYKGRWCSDGGSTQGAQFRNARFKDGIRPQLVVDPLAIGGVSTSFTMGKITMAEYAALVQRGQDDAVAFFQSRQNSRSIMWFEAVPHSGDDCWWQCVVWRGKDGLCDWCGTGNACCRRGVSTAQECKSSLNSDFHECFNSSGSAFISPSSVAALANSKPSPQTTKVPVALVLKLDAIRNAHGISSNVFLDIPANFTKMLSLPPPNPTRVGIVTSSPTELLLSVLSGSSSASLLSLQAMVIAACLQFLSGVLKC